MSLFDPVRVGHRALGYHLRRQNLLASNVANIDTPGFRPRDLVRPDAEERSAASMAEAAGQTPLRLDRSMAGHLPPGEALPLNDEGAAIERVIQPGNDGNAVSLEREMSKVAANQLRYDTVTRLVRQHLGQLRYAASDGANG